MVANATNCNTQITYNGKVITLPYSSKKIHKSFDLYFERKYNEKLYGYAFREKEVLKDEKGEYLLYDSDDDLFIEDNIACTEGHYNGPDYFVMDWVKRIDIKRDKSGVTTKLDLFKKHTSSKKFKISKTLDDYLSNVNRYVEVKY